MATGLSKSLSLFGTTNTDGSISISGSTSKLCSLRKHNTPMQYKEIFKVVFDIFLIFAQNIDRLGGSNQYPQSMFWSKNKKTIKISISLYTPVLQYQSGV